MLSHLSHRLFVTSYRRYGLDALNPGILRAEYAIEGPICIEADSISARMRQGVRFPFDELIRCNIGNPFEVGKKEITFPRQLIAATECAEIRSSKLLPIEVIDRANEFLSNISGGLGAYSSGEGHWIVREHVAKFISKRDEVETNPFNIIITNGASHGIKRTIDMFVNSRHAGIMMPYPTYPVYTAEIEMRQGVIVPCYCDESKGWALSAEEMERSYREATDRGINVRLFASLNPSNPTGAVKTRKELVDIVRFCEDKGIAVLADEVYQSNIYDDQYPFISLRKVIDDLRSPVQIISVNSVSKGFLGECGHRGGYSEFHNFDEKIVQQAHKMATIDQCASTTGQLLLDLLCRPPQSTECKRIWDAEIKAELGGLKWKARRLVEALNTLPGISCTTAKGAMYVFPSLNLPKKAIKAASELIIDGQPADPDMFWAWTLLHETGVVVVPGSGFGEVPGGRHFRVAFLPPPDKMERLITKLTTFQANFMSKYE